MDSVSFRRSFWFSALIAAAILAALIGVSNFLPRPDDPVVLVGLGVMLALVPALVWMAFFNQMDRSEPEPNRLIARAFAFGALSAAAVAIPFAAYVDQHTFIFFPNLIVRMLLIILSISLMQEVLKLAMVRYVVLGTNEFDRHPDGIVYGLATGMGFATVLTVEYILRQGGVDPLAGAIRAVQNALVHGVLGAVTGYYIGRVKIDGKTVAWMATGLGAATLVNGLYQIVQTELASQMAYNPWYELILAAVLAIVIGAALFALFRRALARAVGDLNTISIQAHARDRDMPWDIALRYDGLILGAALIALLVGIGAGLVAGSRTVPHQADELGVSLSFPARWAVEQAGTGRFAVRDFATGALIAVSRDKEQPDSSLDLLVAEESAALEQNLEFYTEVGEQEQLQVDSQDAIQVQFQYAAEDADGPSVRTGAVTYVLVGDRLYIFRYEAKPEDFEQGLPDYERLLRSVRFAEAH